MVQWGVSNLQQAYAQATSTTPTNYPWIFQRDPTQYDIFYAIGTFWVNQAATRLWYLNSQSNASGQLLSTWELISVSSILVSLSDGSNVVFPSPNSASPPDNIAILAGTGISVVGSPSGHSLTISSTGTFETLTGNDNVAVSESGGTILTIGNICGNATHASPLFVWNNTGVGSNCEQWDLQVTTTSTSGAKNINKAGIASFDSTAFTVDSGTGFVGLKGGSSPAVLGLTPDTTSGGGTTPVIPNGSGNIAITSAANFGTGTQANSIRSISTAANTLALQVQLAGSHAATSTANDFGVAQFDANQFTVTSGFVQIIGGGTAGAVTNLVGDDSNAVVPTAGAITLFGATVANATNAKPVYFAKKATSTEELEVQITTTVASGSQTINMAGLASFDSAFFTVDSATGFVSSSGSLIGQTITGSTGPALSPSSGNWNIFGTGSITTVGSGSTLTVELTGLTQYNVLIGAGTATIAKVAPSATSGVPLISQGAASNPVFGTAVVAGGGTGNTSFTPYAVITGGTLSGNPLQSVSGVGTSGQVLTSQGAGMLPVWANTGSTSITLDADSGSATGSTITISGGTTGLTTIASASTMDLTGTLNVGHGGTGATTLTGILTGTGTTAIVGTAITQYNVLTAGASNLPNSVAPSATSGIPLISQGSASQPAFGTAVVAGGGTGNTTFTAYSVIIAGTTPTGAFQNVSGVGTSGQVLTSNGAALPTWQSIGVNNLQITMDAGTTPIAPTADALVFTGAQVGSGVVGTNVIRTDGSAANAMTIQIQRSTTAASSTVADNGVCHFNSTEFSVDSNAFVTSNNITFVAGSGISLSPATGLVTLGGTLTIASTGTGITWQTIVASQTLVANNGYFCISPGGALSLALPTSGATIGTTIEVVLDGSTSWTITQAAGQQVRFGNAQTTSGASGSLASTRQGDSVRLVCETANARWVVVSSVGSITVT